MAVRPNTPVLLKHLPTLPLHRLGDDADAGLVQISLPWPIAPAPAAGCGALGGSCTAMEAIGQWHDVADPAPRRLLLSADAAEGTAATTLNYDPTAITPPAPAGGLPEAAMVLFERCPEIGFMWERHYLALSRGDKRIGLCMGLRHGGRVNWWEACRLVTLRDEPGCRVYHMAGAIPVDDVTMAKMAETPGYINPYLHRHNWLNGDLYIRAYANGVVEVFAHHINSQFFDDGLGFEDVVPVVGLLELGADLQPLAPPVVHGADGSPLVGPWDGSETRISISGVAMDVTEVARLATPKLPGNFAADGQFLVWQPYYGVEVFGGVCPRQMLGDDWITHPEDQSFPRGMARTLRFSMSLGGRSPRIARYLAPHWWYGACAELSGDAYLPVGNAWDARLDQAAAWARWAGDKPGFEDGGLPRGSTWPPPEAPPETPYEPGWDGDVPSGQFLLTYRNGGEADYLAAMRSAYHMTDVCFNHARGQMHMHGYPPGAYSVPMNRSTGTLHAYLEIGDPYLLNKAEQLVETSWRTHLNSWPRLAIGRDACWIRGAVMLYRYFNDNHFKKIAHEACLQVVESQNPQGSFGDQGGGARIHQWGSYIEKPWMALLATTPLMEYMDLCPDEPVMRGCIARLADWLLSVQWERDGINGWSYQYTMAGEPRHFDLTNDRWNELPSRAQWHGNQLARVLGHRTIATGDTRYVDAFLKAYATTGTIAGGHGFSASADCLPWLQARLLRPRLTADGYITDPMPLGDEVPRAATIHTPTGPVELTLG